MHVEWAFSSTQGAIKQHLELFQHIVPYIQPTIMRFDVKQVRTRDVRSGVRSAGGGLRYEGRACVNCSSESVLGPPTKGEESVGPSPFATARLRGIMKRFLPSKTACGRIVGVNDDSQLQRTLTTSRHVILSMLNMAPSANIESLSCSSLIYMYLVTIPLLKALMIREVRRASILNEGPKPS